jgi:hypothetical protein
MKYLKAFPLSLARRGEVPNRSLKYMSATFYECLCPDHDNLKSRVLGLHVTLFVIYFVALLRLHSSITSSLS